MRAFATKGQKTLKPVKRKNCLCVYLHLFVVIDFFFFSFFFFSFLLFLKLVLTRRNQLRNNIHFGFNLRMSLYVDIVRILSPESSR